MKLRKSLCVAACLAIASSQAMGADPETPAPGARVLPQSTVVQVTPQTPQAPTKPTAPPPMVSPGTSSLPVSPVPTTLAPTTDAFVQAPAAGTSAPASAIPNVIGDFIGGGGLAHDEQNLPGSHHGRLPIITRGSFKIAEDESPRPQDRIYLDYNFYSRVQPNKASPSGDVQRSVLGVEKTFLDGKASFGARLPYLFTDSNIGDDGFGDISLIGKLALIDNRETGCLLSVGVMVTLPTGDGIQSIQGTVRDTLIQPFVGAIINPSDSCFIQGFSSVVIPTEDEDVTLLLNSVSIGHFLYRSETDSCLRYLAPALELHVTTPLDHRGADSLFHYADTISMIGGLHIGLGQCSSLSIAGGAPLTGPKPFDFEGIVQFNLRF